MKTPIATGNERKKDLALNEKNSSRFPAVRVKCSQICEYRVTMARIEQPPAGGGKFGSLALWLKKKKKRRVFR